MKFAHFADCHIGSWRDPKLRNINSDAFLRAVDICIDKKVDFILISGDLFNNSLPSLDVLKAAVQQFRKLKDKEINVYVIAGSHDYSPSGKTILDVLESAGLFINVAKGQEIDGKLRLNFTIDKKTNAKITGLLGKRLGLDRSYYEVLDREHLEKEQGFKIFMFHCALEEFKPKELLYSESAPLSLLPKGFNYYAGGHVHYVFQKEEKGYGLIAYPGPLFPNNFKELEELQRGGFYIYDNGNLEWQPIQIYNVYSINLDCQHKIPSQVEEELIEHIKNKEFYDTIVTVRLFGTLELGKPSDIDFNRIFEMLYKKSAFFIMRNTNSLLTKEFEEIKIEASSIEKIEEDVIKEHLSQSSLSLIEGNKETLIKSIMNELNLERGEDERVVDFEKRLLENVDKLLDFTK